MTSLDGLINIRTGFGQNCNFVFWHYLNCTFSFSLCGDIKDKVDSFLIAVTLNGRKFDMLMYPDHLGNRLDFGNRLLIFLIFGGI